MCNRLSLEAHAKINLSLEVVGRRADGFHTLVSIMQTIITSDHLQISVAPEVSLTCSDPALEGADNLGLRAARLLRDRFRVEEGCHIQLDKRIPRAAGLGGGSCDAAAVLTALTRLWGLSVRCEDLVALAAELGSDVPFFLYGGTALVEGRGERVTALPPSAGSWYLLVKPAIEVPTGRIFAALSPHEWTDGARTRSIADRLHMNGTVELGVNGLQQTLFRLYPEARLAFEEVQSVAPGGALVSGSGPTIVAPFTTRDQAQEAARPLARRGYWTEVTAPCPRGEWQTPCA